MTITVSAKIYKVSTLAIIAPRQRSTLIKLIGMLLLFFLTLSSSYAAELKANSTKTNHTVIKLEASQMWIKIGEHRFKATLANTSAAREFAAQLPLTPKGSPEIIIKFQLHHSHPYFSNRVALPPVRNRLVLPNNLAVAV